VLVGVHGGGWQLGGRKFYAHWGNYLARHGYAVFAIEYRLMKPGAKTWPGAVYDTKAAMQVRACRAGPSSVSTGSASGWSATPRAHLSTLSALAGKEPLFSGDYLADRHSVTSAEVKAVIGFCGFYDMQGQWSTTK
jgi:acetyl esterase/lipase